ncbi:hypothetical protein RHMOL_Rhmol02G0295200 [Rhododendron molle]|uniref:Uncharacterized protein n=1 Tax=Rhododendron molle TaxID=49168 RepID=A0ACC0PY16_RHOML|nr:hypothetical protein RHMOL_Rhmol02G0295200 [Rhododendron molle]
MGSMLGDWPSFDPHNFSQLRPSDPSNPSVRKYASVSARYVGGFALFSKFLISSEAKNILLRHFYQRAEDKLRSKRSASENLTPEHGSKHPRATASDTPPN